MAITLSQTASVYRSTGATTQTLSFTTVTDDTDLVVFVRCYDGDNVTAASFNGDSLTLAATTQKQGTGTDRWYCYRLSTPDITTADITLTLNVARRVQIVAASFKGTNAGASEDNDGANGAATSASRTMTSATNGAWHIIGVTADAAITPSSNWTNAVTETSNGHLALGYYEAATAGNVTQSATFSLSQYAINGFVMVPGASAPSNTGFLSLL